ncbi:MAG: VOC family protein, partial [Firmicutes bacterium]|nr:VOC family protein [Bacillota bacterium]
MMPTIRLVNVYVSDLDYAKDWYCQVLGFEVARDLPPLALELRHQGITFLLHKAENPTVRKFWMDSMVTLAFATDNVHKAMQNLKESGVKLIHSEPQFSHPSTKTP